MVSNRILGGLALVNHIIGIGVGPDHLTTLVITAAYSDTTTAYSQTDLTDAAVRGGEHVGGVDEGAAAPEGDLAVEAEVDGRRELPLYCVVPVHDLQLQTQALAARLVLMGGPGRH